MDGLEPLPASVVAALSTHGVAEEDAVLCAMADLERDGTFAEIWLVLTRQRLHVLIGSALAPAARATVDQWAERSHQDYPLSEVDEFKVESLNGNGLLLAARSGQPDCVCRFSNAMSRKIGTFATLANKVRQGEELTQRELSGDAVQPRCPKCGLLYPDPKRRVCAKCLDRRSLFLRVLSFMPRYKQEVTLILLSMLVSSGLQVLSPYLGGRILFDEVLHPDGRYAGMVGQAVLLLMVAQASSVFVSVAYGRVNARLTAEVLFDLKTEVFAAMQRLSLGFFSSKETGNLMTRVNQDAMHLQYFFHDGLPYFVVNLVNLIGITTVMACMNWRLTLMVLVPVPVIVYVVYKVSPRLWRAFSRRYRRTSSLNALVNDALTGVRVVKAFGREEAEIERFAQRNRAVYGVTMQLGVLTSTLFPAFSFLLSLGGLVVWSVGGWDVILGRMSFGTLWTFVGYLGMLYGPLEFMTHIVDWWSSCMNSAQRIFEILDAVPEVAERVDPVVLPQIEGRIELEGVHFGYEPNKPVLQDITLRVEPGEMLGVLGYSGAGKSTLVNLISRLYDPEEGSIRIDGVDVRDVRISDLRHQIGMVLQETYLFAGSIAENVAYAKPDASIEEIIEACKVAQAHDFIVKLSDGYETQIGHRGKNLSGGERQRLSIARAILHDPRILILDEATASVDTETERGIQEGLERLVMGRTTIAIAHRLSTLRNADKLLVLDRGKIVEMGTHEELIAMQGHYFRMLEKQKEALRIRGVEISEQELAGRAS